MVTIGGHRKQTHTLLNPMNLQGGAQHDYQSGRVGDVTEDEDKGFMNVGKSINLGGIVAHLTKAVQELSAKVEALES